MAIVCSLLALGTGAALQAQTPAGPEFRVDSSGSAFPFTASRSPHMVASTPAGAFVVTWTETSFDVLARRFGPGGPLGPEFIVNSQTAGYQMQSAVGVDDLGGFVAVWNGPGGVEARRFAPSGAPLGPSFVVAAPTLGPVSPDVAVAPGGGFVVAWENADGSYGGVFARRYAADGSPLGGEFPSLTFDLRLYGP
jgi:hypothetical protein